MVLTREWLTCAAALLVGFGLCGCDENSDAKEYRCKPNSVVECHCTQVEVGAARCNEEGTATGPCVCDPRGTNTVPQPVPGAPAGSATEPTVLAFEKIFLGDKDRDIYSSYHMQPWTAFGWDLDGVVSTEHSLFHCQASAGANPANVRADGVDGIDNSFGYNLLPLIRSFFPDYSTTLQQEIDVGDSSWLLAIQHLEGGPAQSNVDGYLYEATRNGQAPNWTGSDGWDWFTSPTVLLGGYVSGGLWVGRASLLQLTLRAPEAIPLRLDISDAVVTGHVTGSGASARIDDGIIAGVLSPGILAVAGRDFVAGAFPDVCDPTEWWRYVAEPTRRASDIMMDETSGGLEQDCNAISIGLGFTASAAVLGSSAPPRPVPPSPCP